MVRISSAGFTSSTGWCSVLYRPLLVLGILLTLSPFGPQIVHFLPEKVAEKPFLSSLPIYTSIWLTLGEYNTSVSHIFETLASLGTLITISPFPMALNNCLLAARNSLGGILVRLLKLS